MQSQPVTIIKEVTQPPSNSIYLSDAQVAKRYNVTRQTIWRWLKSDPSFPKPVRFSTCCTRFNLGQLEAYEAGKAGAK